MRPGGGRSDSQQAPDFVRGPRKATAHAARLKRSFAQRGPKPEGLFGPAQVVRGLVRWQRGSDFVSQRHWLICSCMHVIGLKCVELRRTMLYGTEHHNRTRS